ncbi:SDR family NAD(P)-dependent oxidoreductase [Ureibacillus endophyticus]|uniref:SDR family oxidoreductase n=1 Tax=Ureibacillus endophyticus TaxID=1978490 RepID=A0A494YY72_9BACL|nr:SDR family oxidoreductase [Lysinibacillus endophyticus]RKQ15143.1 SDR family oxidoreductase [Lysinibacillus endophyticus]
MKRLENKVAIITGSASGMGRSTAELFAKEGAKVAVTDLNVEQGLDVVENIKAAGGEAHFWKLDVSSEDSIKTVYAEVVEKWGKLDILINNAGVTGVDKPTHELSEEEWDFVFNVDVKGVFFSTKHAIPYLKKNGKGSIVNFSSIYGLVGSHELTAYHAAKGAVTLMTKKDAITYGPDNIRVNSVHPGTILTPLVQQLADNSPGYKENQIKKHPIGFLGKPEDVSYAVLFLASDEARFITGASLAVDGGYTAQ